jgi:FAD/FMN-containing dehydrogenase
VKTATRDGIPFYATGGGHGIQLGYENVKNAVNIDLGNFKAVQVDAANNKMTVGGATLFGDIYTPLYNAGKEIRT